MDLTGLVGDARSMNATPATCPTCGWPTGEPYEVISHHRTSEGVITWSRCPCGRLQVHRGDALVARSSGARRRP